MICLALVLELHHPLGAPGDEAGPDWVSAALACYWPILRGLSHFAETQSGASLTLAISPSWLALAADPHARIAVATDAARASTEGRSRPSLREFIVDRWQGDALAVVRHLGESGAVDVIPMTSSHTWLPSIASDPVVARAQVKLAVADQTYRLGRQPQGIWLPFLSYLPGLESTIGEAGIRFFGVGAAEFLRGTVLPPDRLFAPLVTASGVAAFGVDPAPSRRVFDPDSGFGHDERYRDSAGTARASAHHAEEFLENWSQSVHGQLTERRSSEHIVSVAAVSAHDLIRGWPSGTGPDWLDQVLLRLPGLEGVTAITLTDFLDRHPVGVLGRPGPSSGGILSARPGRSDLFDRCREAALLLAFAVENRASFGLLERRSVAHMARSLLRAQQVDWAFPPGFGISPEIGLARAHAHLNQFYTLAGLLMAGRPDASLLAEFDRGPIYLPDLDIEMLASP